MDDERQKKIEAGRQKVITIQTKFCIIDYECNYMRVINDDITFYYFTAGSV